MKPIYFIGEWSILNPVICYMIEVIQILNYISRYTRPLLPSVMISNQEIHDLCWSFI